MTSWHILSSFVICSRYMCNKTKRKPPNTTGMWNNKWALNNDSMYHKSTFIPCSPWIVHFDTINFIYLHHSQQSTEQRVHVFFFNTTLLVNGKMVMCAIVSSCITRFIDSVKYMLRALNICWLYEFHDRYRKGSLHKIWFSPPLLSFIFQEKLALSSGPFVIVVFLWQAQWKTHYLASNLQKL